MGGKTDDLLRCMDACIGPAGRDGPDRFVGDAAQRLFKCLLNGALARLSLPAVKTAAIVFDAQRQMMSGGR